MNGHNLIKTNMMNGVTGNLTRSNPKSTETKYLEPFVKKHPVLTTHLECKRLMKLKSTYIDNILEMADADNRIHTSFSVTRTGTGRLASSDPNLQNIPVRTKDGENIRREFTAS
jgi:DNA polymerase-1